MVHNFARQVRPIYSVASDWDSSRIFGMSNRVKVYLMHLRSLLFLSVITGAMVVSAQTPNEPGLLFYLSGDHGFNADYAAGGNPAPNFLKDVKILLGGAKGSYLQCGDNQLLSYWAPGNI